MRDSTTLMTGVESFNSLVTPLNSQKTIDGLNETRVKKKLKGGISVTILMKV